MAEVKRRSPAIFDRALGEWQPTPQYIPVPEFNPPGAASPVIPARIGQDILARAEAFVAPQRFPFPYFQIPPPSNPLIPYRVGQWLADEIAPLVGVGAQYVQVIPFVVVVPPTPTASAGYNFWVMIR